MKQHRKYLHAHVLPEQKDFYNHLWYGNFDPLRDTDHYIQQCLCGGFPKLVFDVRKSRWQLYCPKCFASAEGSKRKWQAVLNWNKSSYSVQPEWRKLPLFSMEHFQNAQDAHSHLKNVRKILEARLQRYRNGLKDFKKGKRKRPPGKKFGSRLRAFLQWCIYAQGVCKTAICNEKVN